jgi:regulator of sigma E protease
LFSYKKGGTEYGVGWLPLGGYVKISGMIDESMDKEAMKEPPKPWEFRAKPAWQRLIVMLGGVTVNVILGMVIFSLMTFTYGEKYLPADQLKNGIFPLGLGKDIGLEPGDHIGSINGQKVVRYSDLLSSEAYLGETVVLNVIRNGRAIDLMLPADFVLKLSESKQNNFLEKRFSFYVAKVEPLSNAAEAGLLHGDVIKEIDGNEIRFYDEFRDYLNKNQGEQVNLGVKRGSKDVSLYAQVRDDGTLGFYAGTYDFEYVITKFGLAESMVRGSSKAWNLLILNIKGFGKIIRGDISFSDSVAGPIGIATIYGGIWDWQKFWLITGILSMILAFMNILPIPALDGGHVMFLSFEAISGKKISDKFMEVTQMVGMILLLALMTFIIGNDIWKYILN